MDREDYMREAQEKGRQIGSELCDALNNMTYDNEVIEGFIEGFTHSHRTLQQSAGRAIVVLLERLAEKYKRGIYDARNEALCKFAHLVVTKLEESERYMPTI